MLRFPFTFSSFTPSARDTSTASVMSCSMSSRERGSSTISPSRRPRAQPSELIVALTTTVLLNVSRADGVSAVKACETDTAGVDDDIGRMAKLPDGEFRGNTTAAQLIKTARQKAKEGKDDEAIATATAIWERTNLANLEENILPTRPRATLILIKGADHVVETVALRRL